MRIKLNQNQDQKIISLYYFQFALSDYKELIFK